MKATDYRAVVVVHNESSTGVVTDLAAAGAILREHPTLLVADSVSGLAGLEMQQDKWGVDIVVSASQKCLMCPPGAGLVSMSAKAWEIVRREDRLPRFYWDFRRANKLAGRNIRIGTMGHIHEADILMDLAQLEEVLKRNDF